MSYIVGAGLTLRPALKVKTQESAGCGLVTKGSVFTFRRMIMPRLKHGKLSALGDWGPPPIWIGDDMTERDTGGIRGKLQVLVLQDLARTQPASRTLAEFPNWNATPPPVRVNDRYQPNLEPREALRLLSGAHGRDSKGGRLRTLLSYSGAVPADGDAESLFHINSSFTPEKALAHATFELFGRRLAVRAIPRNWEDRLQTPFRVRRVGDRAQVMLQADGGRMIELSEPGEVLTPESSCLDNLSYFSDGREREEDTSITINPIQTCALRCQFCRRQYDTVDELNATASSPEEKKRLARLTGDQAAWHLIEKYRNVDWGSKMQIAIVTGTFLDFTHMRDFVKAFGDSMRERTQGKFDPANNPLQNMRILTHLAETEDHFVQLKNLGVRSIQNTIEIIGDERRSTMMQAAGSGGGKRLLAKSDVSFDRALDGVRAGVNVLGPQHYRATVILGLDDAETTIEGLKDLQDAGLRVLQSPVYEAFEPQGVNLYQMSAADLIGARDQTLNMFVPAGLKWEPAGDMAMELWRSPGLVG
jgi:hypothetical protein